jgi:hypothetical protein
LLFSLQENCSTCFNFVACHAKPITNSPLFFSFFQIHSFSLPYGPPIPSKGGVDGG